MRCCAASVNDHPVLQAKEAQEAAEACASAATAARSEADALAKEGATAGQDFAACVSGLTAAAGGARDALRRMLEAEEGGRAVAEELQGILGELGNATKVGSPLHSARSCIFLPAPHASDTELAAWASWAMPHRWRIALGSRQKTIQLCSMLWTADGQLQEDLCQLGKIIKLICQFKPTTEDLK